MAALLAVVLVLALVLTQTQVGRDQLARQLESQFEDEFVGSLRIGRLSGNLLWTLHASSVEVRDPDGRVVISADSVVARPRWRSLVAGEFEVRSLRLYRPLIDLVKDDEGGWNLGDALARKRASRAEPARRIDLDLASIQLIDGTLRTRNAGVRPAAVVAGQVFDFTNVRLLDLDAVLGASVRDGHHRLHVRELSGRLANENVAIERLRGRLDAQDGDVQITDVRLRLAESDLTGSARIARGQAPVLRVRASRISGDEVVRLVPALPLQDLQVARLDAEGPLDDLDIASIEFQYGESRVRGNGTVRGLPTSVAFDLELPDVDLREDDVRTLRPDLLQATARPGRLTGRAALRGAVTWGQAGSQSVAADLDLRGEAGSIRGRAHIDDSPLRSPRYRVDARVEGVDLARITGERNLASNLNARVHIEGTSRAASGLSATARLEAGPSVLAGRELRAAAADLRLAGRRVSGSLALESSGWLAAEGYVDLADATADLTLEASSLDLHALFPDLPHTRLTGTAAVAGSGRALEDLLADATVRLDSSTVAVADSVWLLPNDPLAVSLRPAGVGSSRLRMETDAVMIDVGGSFAWPDLVTACTYWADQIAAGVRNELLPRLNGGPHARSVAEEAPAIVVTDQDLRLSIDILQAHALRPWIDRIETGSRIEVDAGFTSDGWTTRATIDLAGAGFGGVQLGTSKLSLEAQGRAGEAFLDHLGINLVAESERIESGDGRPASGSVAANFESGSRALRLSTTASRPQDSVRVGLDAWIGVHPDRYAMRGDFLIATPGDEWRVDQGEVDLYVDGIAFRSFEASRLRLNDGERPRLLLSGVASARAIDTLNVQGHALSLDEVLRFIGLELPFDGVASADLDVTGVLSQPAVVGIANVEDFTIWGDPAGRLFATSEIISGEQGFDIDLTLSPAGEHAAIVNRASVGGRLAFPGRRPDGSRDPGFFDLRLDIDRLDLFIFDHLFPDIVAESTGGARGYGSITGDWSFPIFDADLAVVDGRSRVPVFNLDLEAAGRVTIDHEGIHLRRVALADKAGGSGHVEGAILFNDYRFFSFDLDADLSEFEIIDVDRASAGTLPFYGHIRASGSASLTGPIDNAFLRSPNAVTTPDSRIFIPVVASGPAADAGFLIFTDADGTIPDPEVRRSLIADRPAGERPFLEGLEMLLNVRAPSGSTVSLVFDPVIGDVINAVGSATLQLAITEGEFLTYGTFDVERGDYLFTAGDVFTRRFELERGGTLEWSGDPIDARLDLPATYRTRASLAGLGLGAGEERQRVPFIVNLQVGGRVTAPLVDLSLELDESGGRSVALAEALRRRLNEPDRQAEYATSVLLTNTFLLSPSDRQLTEAADDLLYTSLSELVSTRLNLFLNQALGADNVDVAIGVQQGTGIQEFDVTYGVALRFLDERLIIRGEGVYHQLENGTVAETLQGEVVVEVRVSDAVSVEVFYRREGDLLLGAGAAGIPIGAYGAGVNYQTEFVSWQRVLERLFNASREQDEGSDGDAVLIISRAD